MKNILCLSINIFLNKDCEMMKKIIFVIGLCLIAKLSWASDSQRLSNDIVNAINNKRHRVVYQDELYTFNIPNTQLQSEFKDADPKNFSTAAFLHFKSAKYQTESFYEHYVQKRNGRVTKNKTFNNSSDSHSLTDSFTITLLNMKTFNTTRIVLNKIDINSDLSHLLAHLKRNSPQDKYRRLTAEQEEQVIKHARSLVLTGANIDTGPIEKAVDILPLRQDMLYLLDHLKRHSPQVKYRQLTPVQEEVVLGKSASLVLAGAKKDTGPIEKAVNNILGISS